jgi:hypothetical protein
MGGSGRTPYATEQHNTSQKSPRNPNVTPSMVVVHHAATESFDAVVTMENGTKQVSSTVVIKDGEVASMFDEAYRAWSLSSGYYDSVSLSSETCNSGGAAEGWPISEASYQTLAKVIAEWCRKYNIPANRERIIGHREVYTRYGASYATACPGGIDLDRLVRLVNQHLNGTATASLSSTLIEEDDLNDEQAAQLKETHEMTGVIKQLLAETQQWKGVVATLSEVYQIVGVMRQVLLETEQWDGIDAKGQKTLKMLEELVSRSTLTLTEADRAAIATAAASAVTPVDVAGLTQAVTDGNKQILAAISQVDEATLATFGLKRAA